MAVGEGADQRGREGLEEGKERAESAAQEDDVMPGGRGESEGGLVRIEVGEDGIEEGVRVGGSGLEGAVEGEEGWKEWEDECE